jgi:alkylation response protein AidB-like acyl-CoA dehydrogenase
MAVAGDILERVMGLAGQFAAERANRQSRRALDPADFDRLRATGLPLIGLPAVQGGLWDGPDRSVRVACDLLHALAQGDASVALVCAMHPGVLAFWLLSPRAPAPFDTAWDEQRRRVLQTVADGAWWGTISSEPGSGGDMSKTRATARSGGEGHQYRISGRKHFGSGSGVTSFMFTTAVPEGESEPDVFFMDVRNVPWDGSSGLKLVATWDGHGMTATQSHAFDFQDFPATRSAWPLAFGHYKEWAGGFYSCCLTAVIVGIVEAAVAAARRQLEHRGPATLRSYERVEWARAELESWLIRQAYEGMLRAVEQAPNVARPTVQGKTAIAELAESALGRICRVIGGGTYARSSPFGFWFEDVRSLGFLRPPWGLAYDRLVDLSLPTES